MILLVVLMFHSILPDSNKSLCGIYCQTKNLLRPWKQTEFVKKKKWCTIPGVYSWRNQFLPLFGVMLRKYFQFTVMSGKFAEFPLYFPTKHSIQCHVKRIIFSECANATSVNWGYFWNSCEFFVLNYCVNW